MRIAVTGAPGFLGGTICQRLGQDGHTVRALARPTSDVSHLESLGVEIVVGNVACSATMAKFVDGCECLVHAAVDFSLCRDDQTANVDVNLAGSLRLLDLCRQNDAQFIFISTGAVHETILEDRPLDEAHPVWPATTYGAYKAAVEAFLPAYKAQFGFNGSAYRPTAIYGLHLTKPARSHWFGLVKRVVAGERVDTPVGGKVVHVEDVAEVVARAVGRDDVAGEVYDLTDCHIYDQVVADFAAEAAGIAVERRGLPGPGPKHRIICDKARRTFDVGLDRGHVGIRAYVGQLVEVIKGTNDRPGTCT